ncbi:MAG: hypothetical protein DRR19_01430 [Candidatus Parabeggiatoa sp. nov. 1]|nr:MAG: hypothetical protein DRR19_01430 [Gammaproteobacteria bacterium]
MLLLCDCGGSNNVSSTLFFNKLQNTFLIINLSIIH